MAYQKSGSELHQAKLGTGERFAAVKNSVAAGYEKKGMGAKKAAAIGAAVAAKQGRASLGQAKMSELSRKGRARRARMD